MSRERLRDRETAEKRRSERKRDGEPERRIKTDKDCTKGRNRREERGKTHRSR